MSDVLITAAVPANVEITSAVPANVTVEIAGAPGPAGPTAVSTDEGNAALIGTDGLVFVPTSQAGGVTDHAQLTGLSTANSHPISAITNLQTSLNAKSDATHNHDVDYDALGAATTALTSAQNYADSAITSHEGAADPHPDYLVVGDISAGTNVTLDKVGNSITVNAAATGGGTGGHTIQDEGSPLTARTNLNFKGNAVAATDNAGSDSTDVTINNAVTSVNGLTGIVALTAANVNADPAGTASTSMNNHINAADPHEDYLIVSDISAGSNVTLNKVGNSITINAAASGHTIQDEGVSRTARTNLNFIGSAVTVTDNAGSNATDVTITNAVTSVNTLTGAVNLTYSNVGAEPAGAATTAESNANSYTDSSIAALAAVASSGSYADLSNKPTLGTAAAAATTDFATAAQGALADTAVQNVQGVAGIWTGTQAAYDLLTPSATTLYVIVG